jgi:hypothetical protein
LAFGLAAGALALNRFERHRLAATVLASIVGGITAFALLGYLSGVDTLYGSASVNSPSLPAAVGLLCIAVGITLRIGTMPMLRRSRPLWHLLVMLGCSIVAPLLLFGAYAGFRIANAQFDQVRDDLLSETRILSSTVDQEIIGEIERLQALAASRSLRNGDLAEFHRLLVFPRSGHYAAFEPATGGRLSPMRCARWRQALEQLLASRRVVVKLFSQTTQVRSLCRLIRRP